MGSTIHKPERRPDSEGSRPYRPYFAALFVLVLGLLTHLWGVSKTMRQAEELKRLRTERQELVRNQERLRADISGLSQSSRIRSIAEKKLGMVFPEDSPRNLYLSAAPDSTTSQN